MYMYSVSQYSTGPQHNMRCKYKCDLFVSFYWYISTLRCQQLIVETDFRIAPPEYGLFDQKTDQFTNRCIV